MVGHLDNTGKLLLRLLVGGLLILHGIHKIIDGPSGVMAMLTAHNFPGWIAWFVYIGEVLAPILVILGLFARVGGVLILIDLIVAVLLSRGVDIWVLNSHGGWGIELEVFYGIGGLIIALLGAGRYSVGKANSALN